MSETERVLGKQRLAQWKQQALDSMMFKYLYAGQDVTIDGILAKTRHRDKEAIQAKWGARKEKRILQKELASHEIETVKPKRL